MEQLSREHIICANVNQLLGGIVEFAKRDDRAFPAEPCVHPFETSSLVTPA